MAVLTAALLALPAPLAFADTAGEAATPAARAPVPALTWAACGTTDVATAAGVQCATADLPLDHDRPGGEQVRIALARVPATQPAQRIGSLFFNLGGPGAPAVQLMQTSGASILTSLNERFDIIGFDPRGVGQSTPSIDCKVNQETDGSSPRPWPTPVDLDVEALVGHAQRYVDNCLANNGEILRHASTADVARDLDLLRAAVGDQQLTYFGFSYGTFLGATYAALFPDRYRAMVLDGPVDPEQYADDPVGLSTLQGAGFEHTLGSFVDACKADQAACSNFGGTDPLAAYDALLASAATTPLPADRYATDPRPVTADDIRDVTLALLRAKRVWNVLATALAQAAAGDGSLTRALVDLVVRPRRPDGSYDPQLDRFFTITGGEQAWPTGLDSYVERGAREWVDVPHFWGAFAYSEVPFALWPREAEDAYDGPFAVPGSSPTPLVIATTDDPATPYPGARSMVAELGNARLLTMYGSGHTAFGQDNSACVDTAATTYLVDGTLPAPGTVCRQETPFAAPQQAPSQVSATAVAALAGAGAPGPVATGR
ncbi:alpha/beta hydrolase [Geodermatophilus ruber]|uniref:alpha/beta hydrolase n=1 Tax=Geodermatophilus ruber TaxID=504800 RepID=UPI0015A71E8E|nr:alpha/beta hydrolase [Geodermatophilus ruber]